MQLYGSTTSPYVRRIRILLAQVQHEFINLDIYQGAGRDTLAAKTPTMRVPCLDDDGQMIYDSRIIYRYLAEKYRYTPLTWDQENQLTLVDEINDSFVALFQLSKSGIEASEDALFIRIQKERIQASFKALDEQVKAGHFDTWNYPAICLYALIDWVEFRELHKLSGLNQLKAFREKHVDRIEVTATDPRQ
ncbi:glutathione S-transferase family protein [Salinimonas lutimaris]|uniref:glutathione S-transferase family protein n=1 Tax=Salinimonas lutimaris TaxID=914153 RepID=UPI0010C13DF7|nr:glutathione S-transferase family protein [Salinimonas lutimaris]